MIRFGRYHPRIISLSLQILDNNILAHHSIYCYHRMWREELYERNHNLTAGNFWIWTDECFELLNIDSWIGLPNTFSWARKRKIRSPYFNFCIFWEMNCHPLNPVNDISLLIPVKLIFICLKSVEIWEFCFEGLHTIFLRNHLLVHLGAVFILLQNI